MEVRISDSFTDSLARLASDEQKSVKTTVFDLQVSPSNPGHRFHRLDKAKDKNFWSVRVSSDIRIIVHRTNSSLLLCYVDHHDRAYAWAERRKLETHPATGAAQFVEIRERVQEIVTHVPVAAPATARSSGKAEPKRQLFATVPDAELLKYGVPTDWLSDVKAADEDSLLALAEHLPAEAAEALLELATGGTPRVVAATSSTSPFDHPDAQRRFRVMGDLDELKQALEFPWDKWTVFLHPAQRTLVERDYTGPSRVAGSAGTGKTIVALHRAVFLAKHNPDCRVLLTTFSETLANALRVKLKRLISNKPRLGERLEVHSMNAFGRRLYEPQFGTPQIATHDQMSELIAAAVHTVGGTKFGQHFILSEWEDVVDEWQIKTWEAYRDIKRLGRKTRLTESHRQSLWAIYDHVLQEMEARHLTTEAAVFVRLANWVKDRKHPPYEFAVVDESQDISVSQLKFLAALGGGRPNALFFAGDLGQRIFQTPFSWKSQGVDMRGRSTTLTVNYRTSHQIRVQADRLLAPEVSDVDGNTESRSGTVSIFNGPMPIVFRADTEAIENRQVAEWISDRIKEGVAPHEIGVFVRSETQLPRATAALSLSKHPFKVLDDHMETLSNNIAVGTMHLAKGLEFRAVIVMACDDEIIPHRSRIESISDDADLEEVYSTERHLLYVACTRAREHLLLTCVQPGSEFLDDITKR